MKRIKEACTLQTLSFILDPRFEIEEAKRKVLEEVLAYKKAAKESDFIIILNEESLDDGTILLYVKKKASSYQPGKYFN